MPDIECRVSGVQCPVSSVQFNVLRMEFLGAHHPKISSLGGRRNTVWGFPPRNLTRSEANADGYGLFLYTESVEPDLVTCDERTSVSHDVTWIMMVRWVMSHAGWTQHLKL